MGGGNFLLREWITVQGICHKTLYTTTMCKVVAIYFSNINTHNCNSEKCHHFCTTRNALSLPVMHSLNSFWNQDHQVKLEGQKAKKNQKCWNCRGSDSVNENLETAKRWQSSQLWISRSSLRNIFKTNLQFFPYRIQTVQKLRPRDLEKCLQYACALVNFADHEEQFHKNSMSHEAYFSLNGAVNKQNMRLLGKQDPH